MCTSQFTLTHERPSQPAPSDLMPGSTAILLFPRQKLGCWHTTAHLIRDGPPFAKVPRLRPLRKNPVGIHYMDLYGLKELTTRVYIVDGSDVPVDDVVTLVLNTCTCRLDNNLSIFTTKIVGVYHKVPWKCCMARAMQSKLSNGNLKGPKHGWQMPKTPLNQYHTDNMSVWT